MPARLPKTLRLSPRAQRFQSGVFESVYDSVLNAVSRTPLVIMLWGPRQRSHEWSHRRLEIRAELEQLGHTAFLSEQLGVPIAAVSKKGVEFLQSETADLIVAVQALYGVVGGVNHFVEYRIADAKMLLFIDEGAADQNLYARAVAEMQERYNNVDTFKPQDDGGRNLLLKKIIDKVRLMQMVKYRAIQNASRWGLRAEDHTFSSTRPQGNVQPFRYNLLELYREHRTEIDVLNDPVALFILAFVNNLHKTTLQELSSDIAIPQTGVSPKIALLERAEMLIKAGGMIEPTGFGEHFLNSLGFPAAAPTAATVSQLPLIRWDRVSAMATGAGIALATIVLLFIAALYGASVTQKQAPLQLTPDHTITLTSPAVLPRGATPTKVPNTTATPIK